MNKRGNINYNSNDGNLVQNFIFAMDELKYENLDFNNLVILSSVEEENLNNNLKRLKYRRNSQKLVVYEGPQFTIIYEMIKNKVILNNIYYPISIKTIQYLKNITIVYNNYNMTDATDYLKMHSKYINKKTPNNSKCIFVYYSNFGNTGWKGGVGGGSASIGSLTHTYGLPSGDIDISEKLLTYECTITGKNKSGEYINENKTALFIEHIISNINKLFDIAREKNVNYIIIPIDSDDFLLNFISTGVNIFKDIPSINIIRRFIIEMFASYIPLYKWKSSTDPDIIKKLTENNTELPAPASAPAPAPAPAPVPAPAPAPAPLPVPAPLMTNELKYIFDILSNFITSKLNTNAKLLCMEENDNILELFKNETYLRSSEEKIIKYIKDNKLDRFIKDLELKTEIQRRIQLNSIPEYLNFASVKYNNKESLFRNLTFNINWELDENKKRYLERIRYIYHSFTNFSTIGKDATTNEDIRISLFIDTNKFKIDLDIINKSVDNEPYIGVILNKKTDKTIKILVFSMFYSTDENLRQIINDINEIIKVEGIKKYIIFKHTSIKTKEKCEILTNYSITQTEKTDNLINVNTII